MRHISGPHLFPQAPDHNCATILGRTLLDKQQIFPPRLSDPPSLLTPLPLSPYLPFLSLNTSAGHITIQGAVTVHTRQVWTPAFPYFLANYYLNVYIDSLAEPYKLLVKPVFQVVATTKWHRYIRNIMLLPTLFISYRTKIFLLLSGMNLLHIYIYI